MCSLAGDVMLNENPDSKGKLTMDVCIKCLTEKASIVLRKKDSYCKSCFLIATIHKFRAMLGKYRIIKPNERVLILYQTGHPCTALLHFIRSGLDLSTHKKLRFEPVVLYIDENEQITPEVRFEYYKKITKEINSYKFPAFSTSIHSYINNEMKEVNYIELNDNLNEDTIKNTIYNLNKSMSNLTQYEDTANTCRRQLLIEMAKKLNCRIVLTPEISADIAINLLSNISLGRGAHLSLDVGILDDRDSEIKILQPLRYFDMKELAFYNVFNNLEPNHIRNPKENIATTSVNTLLKKFVNNLQENYPSTIKTVVRTGDKLTCNKTENICRICKAPVEVAEQLSSSEARDFSHWVSTHANDLVNNKLNYTQNTLVDNLCYGCKNLPFLLDS